MKSPKLVSKTVLGADTASALALHLNASSAFYTFTPLPDDQYQFEVKEDSKALLAVIPANIYSVAAQTNISALKALEAVSWLDEDPCDNDELHEAKTQARAALELTATASPADPDAYKWQSEDGSRHQSTYIARQEMVATLLDNGKVELSYLRFVADHFADMDSAKAAGPDFARAVLADLHSQICVG